MDRDGILTSRAGKVQLIKPADLSWDYDPVDGRPHQQLGSAAPPDQGAGARWHRARRRLPPGRAQPARRGSRRRPREGLAHLLFRVAEGNGWTKDALSFNTLVTSWPEILEVARSAKKPTQTQGAFDFDEDD